MKIKLLFKDTYLNGRSHISNRRYWFRIFHSFEKELNIKNSWVQKVSTYNNLIPAFTFFSVEKAKMVRIIQYDYNDVEKDEEEYSRYITAWIDKKKINEYEVSELVICFLPTNTNIVIVKKLIRDWLSSNKHEVENSIQKIYKMQTKYPL